MRKRKSENILANVDSCTIRDKDLSSSQSSFFESPDDPYFFDVERVNEQLHTKVFEEGNRKTKRTASLPSSQTTMPVSSQTLCVLTNSDPTLFDRTLNSISKLATSTNSSQTHGSLSKERITFTRRKTVAILDVYGSKRDKDTVHHRIPENKRSKEVCSVTSGVVKPSVERCGKPDDSAIVLRTQVESLQLPHTDGTLPQTSGIDAVAAETRASSTLRRPPHPAPQRDPQGSGQGRRSDSLLNLKETSAAIHDDTSVTEPPSASPGLAACSPSMLMPSLLGYCATGLKQWKPKNYSPATTITEAQEKGEQVQLVDDAVYALDGMDCSFGSAAQYDCAVQLLKLCLSRRGRLALRTEGLLTEIVSVFARLTQQLDEVLLLVASVLMLALGRPDGDQPLLAGDAAVTCLKNVLEHGHQAATKLAAVPRAGSAADAAMARVKKLVADSVCARGIPANEVHCVVSLALLAMIECTDPQANAPAAERLKCVLREHHMLDKVAAIAAQRSTVLKAGRTTAGACEIDRGLWQLHKCVHLMEHATFAYPDNETYLVGLSVTDGSHDSPEKQSRFIPWLVGLLEALHNHMGWHASETVKDCIHSCLALMMNITHSNKGSCEEVSATGGLKLAALMLVEGARKLQSGSQTGLVPTDQLSPRFSDIMCVALGLLINLVEQSPQLATQLATTTLIIPQEGSQDQDVNIVTELCLLLECTSSMQRSSSAGPDDVGHEEVTVDQLDDKDSHGLASILEVYTSILLGFLAIASGDCPPWISSLPQASLQCITRPIERCLAFYVNAGAITKENEKNLRKLLQVLQEMEAKMSTNQKRGWQASGWKLPI